MWKKMIENFKQALQANAENGVTKVKTYQDDPEASRMDQSYWEGRRDAWQLANEDLERLMKEVNDKRAVFQAKSEDVETFADHVDQYNFDLAKKELRKKFTKEDMDQLHIFLDRSLETLNVVRSESGDKK